jgi:uncharacterized protein (DUF697 family)
MAESGRMGYLATIDRVLKGDFSRASADEKERAARDVIEICSFACAGLVLQPIPGLEQGVLPIQVGMVLAIAHVYGQEIDRKRATQILMDLAAITGVSIVGRAALRTAIKVLLPGIGGVLTAPFTFSTTWGTGYAAVHYLSSGGKPDASKIRAIFEKEKVASKSAYSDSKARENRPDETEIPKDS